MHCTLIRNADLVMTMEPRLGDGALGLITGGDVCIEGDRIAAVGRGLVPAQEPVPLMPRARSSYPASLTCITTCGNRCFGGVGRLWRWAIGCRRTCFPWADST